MHGPRLLVIQHNLDAHLSELGGPLVDAGLTIEPWFTYSHPAPLLDASEYDGVLSLGALVGVKDESDHPWMSVERQVLEKAVAGGIPTLGVCFGGQLLASVAGAPIDRSGSAEIGWAQVEMETRAADDPVLAALGPRPHVFQFHYDTFGIPIDGEIQGRTGDLNQVARIDNRAWAVQFHIEVSPGAIYSWIGTYADEMRGQGVDLDALATETAQRWHEYRQIAHAFGDAFAAEVSTFAARR